MADSAVDLAKRAVRPEPDIGLPAVAKLRRQLDMLEAWHVENALRSGWPWRRVAEALGVTKQAAHRKHAKRLRSRLHQRLIVRPEPRQAVHYARQEARVLGHPSVGPAHLLLGVLRVGDGVASKVLRSLGVELDAVREAVAAERVGGRRARASRPPISRSARVMLERSLREAVQCRDSYVGAEHLLLALIHEHRGAAVKLLGALGVDAPAVERALEEVRVAGE